jgi:dinuclear metal center YbgI/SA1388 family protein
VTTIGEIVVLLESLAPPALAEPWDQVGLQLGRRQAAVKKAMVCLDVEEAVVEEAAAADCRLIIAHHPLFFGGVSAVNDSTASGRAALRAAEQGISVYVAHTNLDKCIGGINDALAGVLKLRNVQVLEPKEPLYKLTVFVPEAALDSVKKALGDAGTGVIGLYSHCSFAAPGKGSFRPLPGAEPSVGEVGAMNAVNEYRLEVEVGASELVAARAAMLAAHPYEEVAYDLYELTNRDRRYGLGRVGDLPDVLELDEFVDLCRTELMTVPRVAGRVQTVRRVAVCGGSGAGLIGAANAAGADVFVSGDIKYHDAADAIGLGLVVIDAGHDSTEKAALRVVSERLREALPIEIIESRDRGCIWR